MTNADKFKEIFELYATELWVMSEVDFLKWLNADYKTRPQTERHLPDYSYEADLGRRIMKQMERSK